MKKITILIVAVLISATVHARNKDIPATIYFHDGTQVEGFIRPVKIEDKKISFKAEKRSKVQKFDSKSIARIRSFSQEDDSYAEIVYLPHYPMRVAIRPNAKLKKPTWLNVLIDGPVSLYFANSFYLVKREDELGPTAITFIHPNTIHIGATPIERTGPKYFADYPELAEKIRNREFRNSREDIRAIVHEYNAWAGRR